MVTLNELHKKVGTEDIYIWIISGIIFSILYSFINIYTFKLLFGVNVEKKKIFNLIILDSFFKSICTIFIPVPYYRLVNVVISIFLIKIFFEESIVKCVVGEATNFIIIICSEVVFLKILSWAYIDISSYCEGMYNFRYKSSLVLLIFLIKLILYSIIKHNNITLKISGHLSKKIKNSIILVCSIETLLIFFNFVEMAIFITDFPYSILILDIFALAIYFYYSIKHILKVAKLEEQDLVIENLESYNKTLSIMYDRIRCFKHDFSNFVQALDGYVKTEDMNGIKSMTTSVLKECKSVNTMGILNPKTINNPAIYSIINNKYYMAIEEMVQMNIEVMFNLQEIGGDAYEFCVILGILLDNAIEAAKETEEKIVNIRFEKNKRNNKVVKIENSYKEKNIDLSQIFEKGYSTKNNKKDHGLGLWNVKRILSHSNNLELLTSKGKLFCQEIEMYV